MDIFIVGINIGQKLNFKNNWQLSCGFGDEAGGESTKPCNSS